MEIELQTEPPKVIEFKDVPIGRYFIRAFDSTETHPNSFTIYKKIPLMNDEDGREVNHICLNGAPLYGNFWPDLKAVQINLVALKIEYTKLS